MKEEMKVLLKRIGNGILELFVIAMMLYSCCSEIF